MLLLFPDAERKTKTDAKALNNAPTAPRHEAQTDSRMVGQGVGFERTRRITGYLVGTLDRFNNAKRAEEKDRVKHS